MGNPQFTTQRRFSSQNRNRFRRGSELGEVGRAGKGPGITLSRTVGATGRARRLSNTSPAPPPHQSVPSSRQQKYLPVPAPGKAMSEVTKRKASVPGIC